ncbi:SNPC4 protein, partial [Atlantisia rogersi]|nr:SNPC4 protein [Atlantisia rogersi]
AEKKRSRPPKRRHVQESSSSSESSSEDVELDLADTEEEEEEEEEEETTSKEQCVIPSIDLWIPTQPSTQESSTGRYQATSLLSPVSGEVQSDGDRDRAASASSELSTLLSGMARAHSADITVKNPAELLNEFSRCGKQVLQVSLENVRRVLRSNTCFQRRLQSKVLKPPATGLTKIPGAPVGQNLQLMPNMTEKTYRQERERLRRMNLDRKLLMAVTPWVGNVLLPCTLPTGKMAFHQTKAASIQEKIKSVRLMSTPLFTLFIQLFQIDTKGCMKVIHERRLKQAQLLRADARRPHQASQNMETTSGNSAQPGTRTKSQRGIPRNPVRRPVASKAGVTSAAVSECDTPAVQGAPPAQLQRQKPKTVSELLREKRLREFRAGKAVQKTVFVAPQMLVSGPLIIQHPPQQILPSAQAGSKPAAAGCANSQAQCVPTPLPAFPSVAGSTSTQVVLEKHSSPVSETGESPSSSQGAELQSNKELKEQALEGGRSALKGSLLEGGGLPGMNPAAAEKAPNQGGCNGQVLAGSSASVVLQNQAFVPQITVVPVGIESAPNKLSLSTPVTCEPNSNGPQQGPVSLLPALVTSQTGSPLIPNSILPFTWVVTPQALLPTAVQVGVPLGMPAAALSSHCPTPVTPSGSASAVSPVPAGASTPHLSGAETEAPSAQAAGVQPSGKTANHGTALLPVTSASPGCTTSSAASATPVCSGGFSKASDSSAAQAALPAGPAAPHAVLLPQPPVSTQGASSQHVSGLTGLGKNHDSATTSGSSSNPSTTTRGIVLQPGDPAPQNSVPRNSNCTAAQAVRTINRPIASKPPATQPADSSPRPTTSSAEKNLLDLSLISLEDERLVKEWLSGKQGVQVPSLQTRLPYLPPFLCNLKTLSRLLLQKAALEEQAACLLPSAGSQGEGTGVGLDAVRELVQQKLGNNPAYLLLKARFLAAFTLPAVLATLPPPKMTTTLSASRKQYEESDEEEWQSEKEVAEEGESGNELTGVQLDGTVGDEPGDKDADLLNQGMGDEEIAAQRVLDSCADVADASAPQIRRSARFRKRRKI